MTADADVALVVNPAGGQGVPQFGGCGEAVLAGHLDVQQRHVRLGAFRCRHHLVARPDLGDHLDVGLQVEHRGHRSTDEGLVVGQQYLDHAIPTAG